MLTKRRTTWLAILVLLFILVDVYSSQFHFSPLHRQEVILTVFVLMVVLIASKRYWRTKWLWALILLFIPFHLAVLWAAADLYAPLLASDNILNWLMAIGELWIFERCMKTLDSRWGHAFGDKTRTETRS